MIRICSSRPLSQENSRRIFLKILHLRHKVSKYGASSPALIYTHPATPTALFVVDIPRDDLGGGSGWPNTCGPQLSDGVDYGFLTGTAQSRSINYQIFKAGQSTSFYASPSFQAGVSNGSPPGFVYGYAGATYFVAGGALDTVLWSRNFTNVSQGTY